jgi:hypothetical protein
MRKKVQVLENGTIALIEESGFVMEISGAVETHDMTEMTEGEWHKLINADRSKHDVVLDKDKKSLTLKSKGKQDKKS